MKNLAYLLLIILCCALSCKKLIQVGTPQNQLTTDKVFADSNSAVAAMVNVYSIYNSGVDPNYNKFMGIYTDDLNAVAGSGDNDQFLSSQLSATDGTIGNFWSYNYNIIYSCNLIIGQLQNAPELSSSLKASLTGEARFLRAFSYFYLVNSFGSVPLILTTNVDQNARAPRNDTAAVYHQIEVDLNAAAALLPADYTGEGRVRANKWSAAALLERVYLYEHKWKDAGAQAALIINSGAYQLEAIPNVFQSGSNETILSFWTQNGFIADAASLIPNDDIPQYPLTADLISSFEPGDLRLSNWAQTITLSNGGGDATYYFPYKYHNTSSGGGAPEYLVALRLGEQYLISAEAKFELSDISGAEADLNMVRKRAGLTPLSATISKAGCLQAITNEWRHEFFAEWGHRFLDLKQLGSLNPVMSAFRPTWSVHADLLPIPQADLAADPLLTQNSGY